MDELPDPDRWAEEQGRTLPPPAGFRYAWRPARREGRLAWRPIVGRVVRCRWNATSKSSPRCEAQAVAELNRSSSTKPLWWAYCAGHLYGRVWHAGEVWDLVLEEVPTDG